MAELVGLMISMLAVGVGLLLPVVFVMLIVGFIIYSIQARQKRLRALAESWGLQAHGMHIRGHLEGVPVQATEVPGGKNRPTRHQIEAPLPFLEGLLTFRPQGLLDGLAETFGTPETLVGDAVVDRTWRIHGEQDLARAILCDPDVQAALHVLGAGRFDGRQYALRLHGRLSELAKPSLDAVVGLHLAVERARRAPWQAVADRHGLELGEEARSMEGFVGGVRVRVEEVRLAGKICTRIRVPLAQALPAGTRITREGQGVRLGDPILDGNVCVTGDAEVLAPLLCHDEGRAAVMSVIHAHPRSAVREDELALVAEGRLMSGLEDALRDALALAKVLGSSSAAESARASSRRQPT